MSKKTDYFRIGVITKTHGIRGTVKVYPTTDSPERFFELDEVLLKNQKEERVLHISKVSMQKGLVLVTFKEFDDINQVEPYLKSELLVARQDAIPLDEDEFYVTDLIGLEVYSDERRLGCLSEVMPTGANDVYVVKTDDKKTIYIPAIRDCIKSVDISNGKIMVNLLPGLEEL